MADLNISKIIKKIKVYHNSNNNTNEIDKETEKKNNSKNGHL